MHCPGSKKEIHGDFHHDADRNVPATGGMTRSRVGYRPEAATDSRN